MELPYNILYIRFHVLIVPFLVIFLTIWCYQLSVKNVISIMCCSVALLELFWGKMHPPLTIYKHPMCAEVSISPRFFSWVHKMLVLPFLLMTLEKPFYKFVNLMLGWWRIWRKMLGKENRKQKHIEWKNGKRKTKNRFEINKLFLHIFSNSFHLFFLSI